MSHEVSARERLLTLIDVNTATFMSNIRVSVVVLNCPANTVTLICNIG